MQGRRGAGKLRELAEVGEINRSALPPTAANTDLKV